MTGEGLATMTSIYSDRQRPPGGDDREGYEEESPGREDVTAAEGPGAAGGAGRSRVHRPVWASRIALLVVLLLSAGLVGLHIQSYRQLSPYDEAQHIDYTYRLLQGNVPVSGDHWLPSTVASVACRTIDYPLEKYPPCGGPATSDVLPNGGLTTAFGHTPAYYLSSAGTVWVSAHLLPVDVDEVSVMRSAGALWLVLAIVLLWFLCRDLGVAWPVRAGLTLGLVASPVVLLAQSTVTNDATALAAGAAVTLATLWWDAGRVRMWVPAVVAVLALLLKATSLAVLLLACTFVLVRCLQRSELPHRRWPRALTRRSLIFVGILATATVVIAQGWSLVASTRATLDSRLIPQNVLQTVDAFDPSWVANSVLSMMSPLQLQFLQSALQGTIGTTAGALANAGLLVLAVIGAVRSQPRSTVRALAIATGMAALSFGPLLTLMNYVMMSTQFGLPARYALSLVPAMAVVAATAVRSRAGQVAFLASGAVLFAAVAFRLLP
jgi:hypothetical protein